MATSNEKQPLLERKATKENNGRVFTTYIRPCIAEFIGTTMFVFFGSMTQQNDLLLAMGVGSGLAYAALVSSFGRLRQVY